MGNPEAQAAELPALGLPPECGLAPRSQLPCLHLEELEAPVDVAGSSAWWLFSPSCPRPSSCTFSGTHPLAGSHLRPCLGLSTKRTAEISAQWARAIRNSETERLSHRAGDFRRTGLPVALRLPPRGNRVDVEVPPSPETLWQSHHLIRSWTSAPREPRSLPASHPFVHHFPRSSLSHPETPPHQLGSHSAFLTLPGCFSCSLRLTNGNSRMAGG